MTTATNLRMRRLKTDSLTCYEDLESFLVKIEVDIGFVYSNEEGYAVKGAKKERIDLGEHPISIRFIEKQGELETSLYHGLIEGKRKDPDSLARLLGRKVRETDDRICRLQKVSLARLAELAKHCAKEQLDVAEAQQYFEDNIFPRDRWHQYVIDEDKERIIDKF